MVIYSLPWLSARGKYLISKSLSPIFPYSYNLITAEVQETTLVTLAISNKVSFVVGIFNLSPG
jgi:hypothetical protein